MTVGQDIPHLRRTATPRRDWRWQERALCRGEELSLFFGVEHERGPEKEAREEFAKSICNACPVRAECLEEALRDAPQHGVWGGMTADERTVERRNILRRKRNAA